MTLGEYLASIGGTPWRWNEWAGDCCRFPADWRALQGFPDPMAKWHGAYTDEATALAAVDQAGGLLHLWIDAMGEPAKDAVRAGDIGVLERDGHAAGAIWTGERWALRTERGWIAVKVDPAMVLGVWHCG